MLNRNEDSCFWLLAALVEGILHPDTYARSLSGCQARARARPPLLLLLFVRAARSPAALLRGAPALHSPSPVNVTRRRPFNTIPKRAAPPKPTSPKHPKINRWR
jgi:hypothetical protein